jgi:glycosyltransferase involved in cell wall biosynthesis
LADHPLFSIIVPVYNRAHLISETISSVLSQTYTAFEIIVVDDGSTDDLKKIIETNFGDKEKIRYFYIPNGERGAARNFGLKQAAGDFAVFFDSDDLMKTNYLETLHKVITQYPGINLLAAKFNYDNNGKIEIRPVLQELAEGWYDQNLFLQGSLLACNYCVRIKNYDYRPFPVDRELASMEDWLFLLINLKDNKIFIRDEIGVTMRLHSERSMSDNQKVIEARKKATTWALNNLQLTAAGRKTLIAWSHYFCGVHEYLDHNRRAAIKEAFTALWTGGPQKRYLLLLAKAIVGKKLIKGFR